MANSPQARKRVRQNSKRRLNNMSQRSSLRSSIKKLLKLISEKDRERAHSAYREAVSRIDRAAVRNLLHSNRAARLKSRLNKRLKSLQSVSA